MLPGLFENCVGIRTKDKGTSGRRIKSLVCKKEESQVSSKGKRANRKNRLEEQHSYFERCTYH